MSSPMAPPVNPYAHWFSRVGSFLLDAVCSWIAAIPAAVGAVLIAAGTDSSSHYDAEGALVVDDVSMTGLAWAGVVVVVLGTVFAIAFWFWNLCLRQGRTGSSLGKSLMGTRLLKESDGQPLGAGMCFLRQILHILDGLVCYLGYLWPLWDPKRQTFADKIVASVVIVERQT